MSLTRLSAFSLVTLVVIGALLSGCSGSGTRPVPVSGTVSLNGQPVAGADVVFMPQQGQLASGQTDAQGRFQLLTAQLGDGAVPGDYAVGISKKEKIIDPNNPQNPYPMVRDVLPPRYGTPSSSGLTAKVQASGRNDFPFDLKP